MKPRGGQGAAPGALVERARDRLEKLSRDVARADRFLRLRIGIVAAWAILSVATLWGACPSSGPTNSLGAEVTLDQDSILGAQILVRNDSARIWEDVVLTLDDGWRFAQPTVRPQDRLVISVRDFRKGMESPPSGYRPRGLSIRCAQGSGRFDLR